MIEIKPVRVPSMVWWTTHMFVESTRAQHIERTVPHAIDGLVDYSFVCKHVRRIPLKELRACVLFEIQQIVGRLPTVFVGSSNNGKVFY